MSRYKKQIAQSFTGMVVASVIDVSSGECVGLEFFYSLLFPSQERDLRRAHSWADKWIANCEKYCTEAA